jgi:amino acid transporter
MVLPQFSLRMVLGLVAVLGFVSLVISRGLQGSAWAMGITMALAALVFAFVAYATVFGLVFAISKVFNRQAIPHRLSRVGTTASDSMLSAQPRDNSNLVPPPASESL